MASPFSNLIQDAADKEPPRPVLFYHDFLAQVQVLVLPDGTIQTFRLVTAAGQIVVRKRNLNMVAGDKPLVPQTAVVSADCRYLAVVADDRVFVESLGKAVTDDTDTVTFLPLGSKEVHVAPAMVAFHPVDTGVVGVLTTNGLLRLFNLSLNLDRAFHSVNLKAHALGNVRAFAFVHAAGGRLTTVEDLSMVFLNSSGYTHARFPLLLRNEKAPKALMEGLAEQVRRLDPLDFAAAADVETVRASLVRHNASSAAESGVGAVHYNMDAPVRVKTVCRLTDVDPTSEVKLFDCIHHPRAGLFLIYAGLGTDSLWFSITMLPPDGLALNLARDHPLILKSLEVAVPDPDNALIRAHNDTVLVATNSEIIVISFGFLKRLSVNVQGALSMADELEWHLTRCVTRVSRTTEFDIIDVFSGLSDTTIRVFGFNEAEKCIYFANCNVERRFRTVKGLTEGSEGDNGGSQEAPVPEGLRIPAPPTYLLSLRKKQVGLQLKAMADTLKRLDGQRPPLDTLDAVIDTGRTDPTFYNDVATLKHTLSAIREELAVQAVRQNELSVSLTRFAADITPKLDLLQQKRERVGAKVQQLHQRFQNSRQNFTKACQDYLDDAKGTDDHDGSSEFIAERVAPRLSDLADQIATVT